VSNVEDFQAGKGKLARQRVPARALRRRVRRLGGRKVARFADVSSNNGPLSRAAIAAYAKDHDLLIVKVSEGTSYVNPYAAQVIAWAKAEGLIVCPYHFARPDQGNGAAEEARHFVKACRQVGLRLGKRRRLWFRRDELPGCLDYEEPAPGDDRDWIETFKGVYRDLTKHGYTAWRKHTSGATAGPLLYGGSIVREQVAAALHLLFWLAAYVDSPDAYWPSCIPQRLRMAWQYTDHESFPGIGQADGSVFYGRVRDLVRLAV
jgi:GH25 family lysozyme M1 (1,4-beta-N-acetylmuramidase)